MASAALRLFEQLEASADGGAEGEGAGGAPQAEAKKDA